jgi:sugar phosphate isomerase/epimerase
MKIACGWLYTLNQYGYPPSLEDTLRGISKAAEWGFEAFEMEAIGAESLQVLWDHRQELKRHIERLGLTLANFVPMLPDVVSLEASQRAHALELFERGTELAASLGAQLVMTDSYEVPLKYAGEAPGEDPIHYGKNYRVQVTPDFDWDRVWENLVSVVSRCAEMAAQHGLRLAMELRVGEAVSNSDGFLRLYEAVNRPNFGVVFDTAHLNAQKEILPLSVEKLKARIFLVHAADNDSRTNQHLALGDGTIDWVSLFQALRKHHFEGYVALDIGDCPDLEAAYLHSKKFLETLVY